MAVLKDVNRDIYLRAMFRELHGEQKMVDLTSNAHTITTIVCENDHNGLLTTMTPDVAKRIASRYSVNKAETKMYVDGDVITSRNRVVLERIDSETTPVVKFAELIKSYS